MAGMGARQPRYGTTERRRGLCVGRPMDRQKPHHILCADGDASIGDALMKLLREWGYTAEAVSNGPDVESRLTTAGADLLIIDLDLKSSDPWATVHRAREIHPGLPIVFTSGAPSPAERLDHAVFLSKPFDFDELHASVRALLGETDEQHRTAFD